MNDTAPGSKQPTGGGRIHRAQTHRMSERTMNDQPASDSHSHQERGNGKVNRRGRMKRSVGLINRVGLTNRMGLISRSTGVVNAAVAAIDWARSRR